MAAGTPWVSFNVGHASQLAGGIVADGLPELLDAARQVLDGARPELGGQGQSAWETEHRWESILPSYESVFENVLATSATRA